MNLILVGYRGAGKTTIGEILARRMGWHFVDLDDMISRRAGKTIAEIFETEGESGFRRRERETCELLRKSRNQVIALGGGTLVEPENRNLVKRIGKAVWLKAPAAVLWSRISRDKSSAVNRPNLSASGGLDEVEKTLCEREAVYAAVAAHVVETTVDSPEAVAEAIEMWFAANDSESG